MAAAAEALKSGTVDAHRWVVIYVPGLPLTIYRDPGCYTQKICENIGANMCIWCILG